MNNHSGTFWASPGRIEYAKANYRHIAPCGCKIEGYGNSGDPLKIIYCTVHGQAHKTRNIFQRLLGCIPGSIRDLVIGKEIHDEALNHASNISSPTVQAGYRSCCDDIKLEDAEEIQRSFRPSKILPHVDGDGIIEYVPKSDFESLVNHLRNLTLRR